MDLNFLLVFLFDLELLRNVVEPVLGLNSLLLDFNRVFKFLEITILVVSPLFGDLEQGFGHLVLLNWLVTEVTGIWIDVFILGSSAVVGLWLQIGAVHLL